MKEKDQLLRAKQQDILGDFPFFGAGVAQYYDDVCELYIKFKSAPTKQQITKICFSAPAPLLSKKGAKVTGSILLFSNKTSTLKLIQKAYGKKGAVEAFEHDVENWLIAVNEIHPIEFVFRTAGEDTGLSEWHEQSCKKLPGLVKIWNARPDSDFSNEQSAFSAILSGLVDLDLKLPKKLVSRFSPEIHIYNLLMAEDYPAAMAVFEKNQNDSCTMDELAEGFFKFCVEPKDNNEKRLYMGYKHLLEVLQPGDARVAYAPFITDAVIGGMEGTGCRIYHENGCISQQM